MLYILLTDHFSLSHVACTSRKINLIFLINPSSTKLICKANQLTGFCMRATLALNGLSRFST